MQIMHLWHRTCEHAVALVVLVGLWWAELVELADGYIIVCERESRGFSVGGFWPFGELAFRSWAVGLLVVPSWPGD